MKHILTYIILCLLVFNATSQTITNPSSNAGYDQQKLGSINPSQGNTVTLSTDSTDYHPGSEANITGGGFLPGESVTLVVQHRFGSTPANQTHAPWTVVADATGSFTTSWLCGADCFGERLIATADGQVSGIHATATFTDALPTNSCFIDPDPTYTSFPGNDDGSVGPISLPFTFNLYGSSYTSVYVNNNGNITFQNATNQFSASGFPFGTPMIAPFWSDVDTRSPGSGVVMYKVFPTYMIITWKNVGYYNEHSDLLNTFQVIISDGTDPIIGVGNNVSFNYGDMQWTTGDASNGSGGFGGISATVGVNKGDNVNYVQVGQFNSNNSTYNGPNATDNGVSYLDYECYLFNVSGANNLPPSVNGIPNNYEVDVTCGEDQTISLTFLGPEGNQTVNTTVDTTGLCGAVISVSNGNVSTADVTITGSSCNIGSHTVTFTANDNYSPAGTTVVNITINVSSLEADPTVNSPVCEGSDIQLSVNSAASYQWSGPNNFLLQISLLSSIMQHRQMPVTMMLPSHLRTDAYLLLQFM
jgi:hypothetical protein